MPLPNGNSKLVLNSSFEYKFAALENCRNQTLLGVCINEIIFLSSILWFKFSSCRFMLMVCQKIYVNLKRNVLYSLYTAKWRLKVKFVESNLIIHSFESIYVFSKLRIIAFVSHSLIEDVYLRQAISLLFL